jgi:aspartyl/asparaginyl-tRNA synthetase
VSEEEPFPITLKEHGTDFLMEHRHLWIRTPRQSAILRIRAEIIKAARDYLDDNGFVLTDPPILTPAACEGTSTLFPVEYFGDRGVPDAERPALHREHGDGAGQGLFVRADLSRREIEDAAAT